MAEGGGGYCLVGQGLKLIFAKQLNPLCMILATRRFIGACGSEMLGTCPVPLNPAQDFDSAAQWPECEKMINDRGLALTCPASS